MLKAAIFDMDGLMFDTEPIWDEVLAPALATQDLKPVDGLMDQLRGSSGEVLFAKLRHCYGQDCDAEAICEAMDSLASERFKQGVAMKKGLKELLVYLKSKGIKTAVASSSNIDMINNHLSFHNLEDYFDELTCGQEVKKSKPNPDIFLLTAKKLGAQPSQTVVFEDSIAGINAAISGGFNSVMVPDMVEPDQELIPKIDFICESLADAKTTLVKAGLI